MMQGDLEKWLKRLRDADPGSRRVLQGVGIHPVPEGQLVRLARAARRRATDLPFALAASLCCSIPPSTEGTGWIPGGEVPAIVERAELPAPSRVTQREIIPPPARAPFEPRAPRVQVPGAAASRGPIPAMKLAPERTSEVGGTAREPAESAGLDGEIIQARVRRFEARIRYCYESRLRTQPALAGTVEARFWIGPDGRVAKATARALDGMDGEVARCVAGVLEDIDFPPSRDATTVKRYPFRFHPAQAAPSGE